VWLFWRGAAGAGCGHPAVCAAGVMGRGRAAAAGRVLCNALDVRPQQCLCSCNFDYSHMSLPKTWRYCKAWLSSPAKLRPRNL
jgi:hypothetical protein